MKTGTYYYFGGRMVKNGSAWVYGDRLGVDREVLSIWAGAAERDAEWDGEVHGVFEGCGDGTGLCGSEVLSAGDGEVFDGGSDERRSEGSRQLQQVPLCWGRSDQPN